jgi:hypothetical protein
VAITLLTILVAFSLAATTGCMRGPRVRGGNLKEQREKKRALKEAQARALEEERRREMEAAAEEAPVPAKVHPDVVPPQPPPSQQPVVPDAPEERVLPPQPGLDYGEDRCRVTLRRPDGSETTRLIYQPSFGYVERTYRSAGGVRDHEVLLPQFRFRVGLSLHKVKFRTLDRMQVIRDPDSRTNVRLRFHFRKGRKPVEYPAEELLGSGHPQAPFLQGLGTAGLERFPLFLAGEDPDDLLLVEVDFTP